MTPALQTALALALVALAAAWLVRRAFAKRKHPGCGHDCGCGPKLKPALRERRPYEP